MRLFLALVFIALLTGPVSAADPDQVIFDSEINVPMGAVEVLKFANPFETVKVISKGVVEANAITDHQLALTGIGLGSTVIYVYGPEGKQLYSARILVEGEARGHRVNIYSKKETHEYYAYYCTPTNCMRIKDDLEGAPRGATQESRTTTIYKRGD
jgi:hypothetical protein